MNLKLKPDKIKISQLAKNWSFLGLQKARKFVGTNISKIPKIIFKNKFPKPQSLFQRKKPNNSLNSHNSKNIYTKEKQNLDKNLANNKSSNNINGKFKNPANQKVKDLNSVILKPLNGQITKEFNSKNNKNLPKLFTFGQKNLTQILDKKPDFLKTLSQNINLNFKKIKILQTPNKLISGLLVVSLLLFFLYISFFDTYFLVKDWQISFSQGSYISKNEQEMILNKFSGTKIVGIFPSNQFWFVNDRNLTILAQSIIPEIAGIRITNRNWPNKIDIEITTLPILLTIKLTENGQNKLWRVLPNGKILTQDKAGIADNLVTIELPINFDQKNFDLQKYPIFEDIGQLNRLYFVINLWSYLKEFGILPVQTILPSLNSADKDVFVILDNGTKLYFDSNKFSRQTQKDRLQSVLESGIMDKIKSGELAYVDFRISKRIHICPKNKDCASENLQGNLKPKTAEEINQIKTDNKSDKTDKIEPKNQEQNLDQNFQKSQAQKSKETKIPTKIPITKPKK